MTRPAINKPSHSIHVNLGARSYAIVIRRDLLQEIGEELKRLKCAGKVGVVTDRNLAKHYLPQVTRRLKAAGFTVVPIVLPPRGTDENPSLHRDSHGCPRECQI